MKTIEQIMERRAAILKEMAEIDSMRRGTISEQYFKSYRKGRKEPVIQGPYYLISRNEGGKTVSERLKTEEEVEQARQDVEAGKKFDCLCKKYEELSERLGKIKRMEGKESPEKKLRKSRSKKTLK